MFYESKNSLHNDLFKIERGRDFCFPLHMHDSFELITVTSGQMQVKVGQNTHLLTPGAAVLVFPHQLHSLHSPEHNEHLLCIFSPQQVAAYGSVYLHRWPKSNLFSPDPFYLRALEKLKEDEAPLRIKALLYSLCAEFDATARYEDKSAHTDALLLKIFRFVERRFRFDCSLERLAEELSYHPVYLSRYFKKQTGLRFWDYVTRYRVNESIGLLTTTEKKILDVALESGFDSLRSFNRSFKAVTGLPPGEYRRSKDD